ncbi:MAG: GDSL-type esterase/lipase family protein, partial [Dysgonamonadaceae bacterium]|nr:GDSL-type esterase/lipase family protein [Dysgonamonadaceae bacterium]
VLQTSGSGIGVNVTNTNDRRIFESDFIVPKADGKILFEIGIQSVNAYISAMKMEEYSDYELPAAEKTFYIDFGKNNSGLDGSPTASPDVNENHWNNMYSNGDNWTEENAGFMKVDLVNSTGEASPYQLETGSTIRWNGVRQGGLKNPDAALLGDFAVETATHDYLFIDDKNGSIAVLYFKNLNKEKSYRFYIFGSRADNANNRIGYINLAGSNSITGIHQMGGPSMCGTGINGNNQNIFVSDPLIPDREGTITLTLTKWLSNYAHINAMKVEELDIQQEPADAISIVGGDITSTGGSLQLSIQATPANSYYPDVSWSVDDENIALITSNGKLYARADGTVTVTATATFNDETSISDTKDIVISNQDINDYSLTVMGSSVPNGEGATGKIGYAQMYQQYLGSEAQYPWTVKHKSVNGNNTTQLMARWENDFLPTKSRYIYYGLSLANEGIRTSGQTAFDSYQNNMATLIEWARNIGRVPLAGNVYPQTLYNAADYNYVKQMNLLMHEWDIPTVNLLGAVDDGNGRWVSGYRYDDGHPNTKGHTEMFYAFVPSLLDALSGGKAQPQRDGSTSITLKKEKAQQIAWKPENILHAFTLSFSFKTSSTSGTIASFTTEGNSSAYLKIDADGKPVYYAVSASGQLKSAASVNDGAWHQVSLTHYYARGATFLYIDGVPVTGSISEQLVPTRFCLNDIENTLESVDFRDLFFHRSGMTPDEIAALHSGKMLKSSLEIYAPLDDSAGTPDLCNSAQSLNTLSIEDDSSSGIEDIIYRMDKDFKEIAIYSVTGQLVLLADTYLNSLDTLKTGVYVVKMTTRKGESTTQKIVVRDAK